MIANWEQGTIPEGWEEKRSWIIAADLQDTRPWSITAQPTLDGSKHIAFFERRSSFMRPARFMQRKQAPPTFSQS